MFEHFTDRARRVVVLAQEEARWFNHNYIGTEHFLLGLVHEGESLAVKVLESWKVSLEDVRRRVEEVIGHGQGRDPGAIPFTPRAKKVLEISKREAKHLGRNAIGPEHILLGLVREGEGVACQILASLGVNLDKVREEVLERIQDLHLESESSSQRTESVRMTFREAFSSSSDTPTCPGCRIPLAGRLSSQLLDIEGANARLFVVYCTSCGTTIDSRIEEPGS